MSQFLGTVTVAVNGKELNSKPGASFNYGGFERTEVTTDQQTGFSKTRKPASVECDIVFDASTSLKELSEADDVTVTFTPDVGKSYVMANAWLENPPAMTGGDGGSVPLTFKADSAEEVGAANGA